MTKHRTHKGTSKRFKITKTGKVLHRAQGIRHLRSGKKRKTIREKKQMQETTGVFGKKILQLLGKK